MRRYKQNQVDDLHARETSSDDKLGAYGEDRNLSDLEYSDFEKRLQNLLKNIDKNEHAQERRPTSILFEGVFVKHPNFKRA